MSTAGVHPVEPLLREKTVVFVTGKGGSGKTTVAAALGIAAATWRLERGLAETIGCRLDLIVVNGVFPDRFSEEEAERLQALATRSHPAGALQAALREHHRARIHFGRARR